MKKAVHVVISTVALAGVGILNQGCASLGKLPANMAWYKPGVSAEETQHDWLICQQQALQATATQSAPNQFRPAPEQPPDSPTTIQPNAYGLGVNADQYGRPSSYQLQNGQQLDPIFYNGVKQNAYGPGVGQDQFGRPVYNVPYGNYGGQGSYGGQGNDAGGELALRLVGVLSQNHMAKKFMKAKGYSLVKRNSPLVQNRDSHR